jgi:hypothetical protein
MSNFAPNVRALSHGFVGSQLLLFQSKVCHVANFNRPHGRPKFAINGHLQVSEVSHLSHLFYVFLLVLVMLVCLSFIIWCVNGHLILHRLATPHPLVCLFTMVGCDMLIDEELFVSYNYLVRYD